MTALPRATKTVHGLLEEARSQLHRLEPAEAAVAARCGGLIVDIRSERQRDEEGLVPGAYFVPRNVLEWRADSASGYCDPRLAAILKPLILMCAQGYQSSLAAAALQDIGVAGATDMIGGFQAWRSAGLPIIDGP